MLTTIDHSVRYFYDGRTPLKIAERDRKNWVIRDFLGTSLHFNFYSNSLEARGALALHVQEFKDDVLFMKNKGYFDYSFGVSKHGRVEQWLSQQAFTKAV